MMNAMIIKMIQHEKKYFKDFQCVAGSFFISLHHGRYSMALFLHVLSPQNDVALVRPMTPKHFRILWCVKAQESSTHDRDRFAWARSGLRGNPRNEKHPGHGSPQGDREVRQGF